MGKHHPSREGVVAGMIGAASVAVWFFIVDSIAGRPLFTPAVLGAALFDVVADRFGGRGIFVHVAAYTVVHFAAFIVVGILAATAIHALHRRPSMLAGFVALFVVFECAFALWLALLARSPLFGRIAWYQFGAANLLAAFLMGRYLWRAHHPTPEERWLRARAV